MTLESLMARSSLALMANLAATTPPGPFVEVGVWRGGSAMWLLELAKAQKRDLHLFDTFAGMPWKSEFDKHDVGHFGENIDLEAMKRELEGAHFHVGIFPVTLPSDLIDIAFVHEDSDQYESTKAVIEYLYPRLVHNGVMLFDDYGTPDCPGSRKAILEAGFSNLQVLGHHAFVIKGT